LQLFRNKNSQGKNQKSETPLRMQIIMWVIGILFALLIGQLVYLQLIYGKRFESEVQQTDQRTISTNVPRGVMYDSQGRVLVGNQANNAITYTRSASTTTSDILKVSNRLAGLITLPDEKPTKRQLLDYYLADSKNNKRIVAKLPRSKRYDSRGDALDSSVVYNNTLEQAAKEHLHFTKRQRVAALLFNKISGAYTLSTIYLKNKDLTSSEIATVGEHLSELPGVGIGTDWSRSYPSGNSIKSIIGSVSTEKSGLPSDQLTYYLTNGYSRNDRVGTSYLEQEYEPILRGSKARSRVSLKSDKVQQTKMIYPGKTGASLFLTINAKYQQEIQSSLRRIYSAAEGAGAAAYSNGAYAVVMNPRTGAILAMAGISHDPSTNKDTDDALGVVDRSFVMGSAVKGATVAGGLMNNIISPSNSVLPDTPIYLPGSPIKKSVYPVGTFGALDAQSALEVSSNIYMMQLALRWTHAQYVPHSYIHMKHDSFDVLRRNFAQFGLGQKTGIDLPGEVAGIKGSEYANGQFKSGSVLDLAYGNYDAYTLIQMAQYISTIANGGYRMRPYLVQSIGHTDNTGKETSIYYNTQPQVQMRIPWTQDQLDVIHQGMWRVVHGTNGWGTAHDLKNVKPSISGKTGTAETFYYDPKNPNRKDPPQLINASFVGFAPSSNPKLAFAIVFPGLDPDGEGTYTLQMGKAIVEDYFKLYK
jgi:cell division protein FtsI/penicillin-binding protein 2